MNKIFVCAVLVLAGCAQNTSPEVNESIECTTDCQQRYENIKRFSEKALGYHITYETKSSFQADFVSLQPGADGYTATSRMNVNRYDGQIDIDIQTSAVTDVAMINRLKSISGWDISNTPVMATERVVIKPNNVEQLFFNRAY